MPLVGVFGETSVPNVLRRCAGQPRQRVEPKLGLGALERKVEARHLALVRDLVDELLEKIQKARLVFAGQLEESGAEAAPVTVEDRKAGLEVLALLFRQIGQVAEHSPLSGARISSPARAGEPVGALKLAAGFFVGAATFCRSFFGSLLRSRLGSGMSAGRASAGASGGGGKFTLTDWCVSASVGFVGGATFAFASGSSAASPFFTPLSHPLKFPWTARFP